VNRPSIVVNDQDTVAGATNVQFDAVDPESERCSKRRECVLALAYVQSTMGKTSITRRV